MILVTGASGNIGSEAVRLLIEQDEPTRALVREPSRASQGGAEYLVGDFDRPSTLDAAMDGVDTLLLVSPAIPTQEIAVIDSAARHGVTHIVKITNHKATAESPIDRRRDHAQIEAHLRASGLGYTLLAPNLFMQNLFAAAPMIRRSRQIVMSVGDGLSGMVDARDVAATGAAVAAAPVRHAGRKYLLTGPELTSYTDVANTLSKLLGDEVVYRKITPNEHRTAMIEAGVAEPVATSNAQVFGLIAGGDAEWLSDDVAAITGTPPRTVHTFLSDHITAFT
ncbi:MAG: NmrA family NAD(P)-binding protein [Mycobacterium sp.]